LLNYKVIGAFRLKWLTTYMPQTRGILSNATEKKTIIECHTFKTIVYLNLYCGEWQYDNYTKNNIIELKAYPHS